MTNHQIRVSVPEPQLTTFDVKRSGMPEIVVVNDALLSFIHTELFPWHLCVTIQAVDLVQNGMPSPEESELLFSIGDEIEKLVTDGKTEHNSPNAMFLARSTWNTIRELLFQVHDPDIAHNALQSLLKSRVWLRRWEYEMEEDREWSNASNLFQLFPQANGSNV